MAQTYRTHLSLKVKLVNKRNLPALGILQKYKTAAVYHRGRGRNAERLSTEV